MQVCVGPQTTRDMESTAWAGPVSRAAAILRTTEVKSENVLQQGGRMGRRLIWICCGGTSPPDAA